MRFHRILTLAGLLVGATACRDLSGPVEPAPPPIGPSALILGETYPLEEAVQQDLLRLDPSTMHFLRQAPTAPALEAYQHSFWAVKGRAASVTIRYDDAQRTSFLQFDIPRSGLASGANGSKLRNGDSVLVTLTIDPTTFDVDFQPSGVLFNARAPATLQYWYHHADPDLNGDQVVDGTDAAIRAKLSIWYTATRGSSWLKVVSDNETASSTIFTHIFHFSGYAISW